MDSRFLISGNRFLPSETQRVKLHDHKKIRIIPDYSLTQRKPVQNSIILAQMELSDIHFLRAHSKSPDANRHKPQKSSLLQFLRTQTCLKQIPIRKKIELIGQTIPSFAISKSKISLKSSFKVPNIVLNLTEKMTSKQQNCQTFRGISHNFLSKKKGKTPMPVYVSPPRPQQETLKIKEKMQIFEEKRFSNSISGWD